MEEEPDLLVSTAASSFSPSMLGSNKVVLNVLKSLEGIEMFVMAYVGGFSIRLDPDLADEEDEDEEDFFLNCNPCWGFFLIFFLLLFSVFCFFWGGTFVFELVVASMPERTIACVLLLNVVKSIAAAASTKVGKKNKSTKYCQWVVPNMRVEEDWVWCDWQRLLVPGTAEWNVADSFHGCIRYVRCPMSVQFIWKII